MPRFSKGFFYATGLTLTTKGKDLLVLPLLLHLIGLDLYGVYIQVLLIGSMLSVFASCGMDVAIVRFAHRSNDPRGEMARVLSVVGLTGGGVLLLWAAIGGAIVSVFGLPGEAVWWAAAIAGVEAVRSLSMGFYRSTERYGRIGLFFILLDLVDVVILAGLVVFFQSSNLETVVLIYIGVRSLSAMMPVFDIRPRFADVTTDAIVERVKFGSALVPKEIVLWLGHSADRFMISYLLGPAATGAYAAAYRVASVVKLVSQPISFMVFPELAKRWDADNAEKFRWLLRRSVLGYLVLASPVLLLLVFGAGWVLGVISEDLVGYGTLTVWVAVGMLFHTIQGISSYYVFVLAGRVHRYTAWMLASFAVGLPMQFLLLVKLGLVGAAIGSFLMYVTFWLLISAQAKTMLSRRFHHA